MPPDWLRIKQAREDLTDYLIHRTRGTSKNGKYRPAIETLKAILECGCLIPSFAPNRSVTANRSSENTVQGSTPVVCFTEQPLSAFIKSCQTLPGRFEYYGVAVRKDTLFEYGGRPVIYGDKSLLESLPDKYKHLWVNFQPIPLPEFNYYPLDWTHEREWRATVNGYHVLGRGTYLNDGVPLLLPPLSLPQTDETIFLPWILVKSETEATEMRNWIRDLPPYTGENGMMREYRKNLPFAPIIPLEVVKSKLSQGEQDWARLDTLPLKEIDPDSAGTLIKVGWNTQ